MCVFYNRSNKIIKKWEQKGALSSAGLAASNLDSKVHLSHCKPGQMGVNVNPALGGANGEKWI